jgi:hypothetical protein
MFTYPVGFWNPINQGGGGNPDPHANNVVLFLRADQNSLVTNTTTTANFTVPAINSTVTINVGSSDWAAANRAIRISNGAGNYIITAIPNGTQLTVRNCGGNDNVVTGTVISSGASIALSILDSSPLNKPITAVGDPTLSTNQSKYGGSSIYFPGNGDNNGNGADILTIPNNGDYNFTSRIFTLETWIWIDAPSLPNVSGSRHFSCLNTYPNSAPATGWAFYTLGNTTQTGLELGIEINGSTYIGKTINIPNQQLNHIGFCQNGNIGYFFLNGAVFSVDCTGFTIPYTSNLLKVGGINFAGFGHFLNGYMDSTRITKDVCRYTTAYNPETDTFLNPQGGNPGTRTLLDIFGADLVVNYSAKSVIRSVVSGEDRISQWTDRSGNNNHATQSTSSLCPIYDPVGFNGLPVAKLLNSRWMNMPNCLSDSWGQASLFILYNLTDTTQHFSAMHTGSNSSGQFWGTNNGLGFTSYFGEFRTNRFEATPGANQISVAGQALIEVFSGVGANTYIINRNTSNKLTSNPAWAVSATPYIGRSAESSGFRLFNGDIAEIAIINRTPTTEELADARQYFKNEWNLTIY